MIFDVGESEFASRVVERSREVPVVVDFWAEWCGPCRQLGPALEAAVAKRGGKVELAKVDVDANQSLAASFGVQGIPAVKAFRDGQVVAEFTGAIPPAQIEAFLDGLVPSPADELVAAGDEASLREALALDPRHPEAAAKLGRMLLRRGDGEEALELLEPLSGDFLAEGLAARARARSAGNGDEPEPGRTCSSAPSRPGTRATTRPRSRRCRRRSPPRTTSERRDLIRRAMVGIFTELGADTRSRASTAAGSPRRFTDQGGRPPRGPGMDPISGADVPVAFVAGLVSFLSPCVLPLVPGYLPAVTGVSVTEIERADWRRVLGPSLLFIASFSTVFILLGLTATALGQTLRDNQDLLTDIGAVLLIVMGVLFIAATYVDRLNREWHVEALLARAGKGGPIDRRRRVLDRLDAVRRARRSAGSSPSPGSTASSPTAPSCSPSTRSGSRSRSWSPRSPSRARRPPSRWSSATTARSSSPAAGS